VTVVLTGAGAGIVVSTSNPERFMPQMPALALAAVPGRRAQTLELAQEIERRGFSGIYCASFGDGISLCLSLAHATKTIRFGTAIANIYARNPLDMALTGAYIHELSGGRFDFGIGVSHGPNNKRLGVDTGKPVSDMREYVEKMRSAGEGFGKLPPLVLATLRKKMVALSVDAGDGAVWANAARSHMAESLKDVPRARIDAGFFVGDMLPTCIDDDIEAAKAVNKRTLTGYLMLPNYRNYWKEAGYTEEMEAVEQALAAGERDKLPGLMTDRWLSDCTLYGPVGRVREGLEAWFAAGVSTPIVVPSSTKGGQFKAFEEAFAAFS
jgi:alkanesulfonate monooxygenase SsuD/methylene tetrahydromethanopterin reductase-like flavin-dependent oxidoreductase (luciferase family)